MVGILLKIGKQSENVGEEEVFGRFCIRDVTENPSGGLLRRADIRRIPGGYPPSRNRVLPLVILMGVQGCLLFVFLL